MTVPTGVMRKKPRAMFNYKLFPQLKDIEIGDNGQMEVELFVKREFMEVDEYSNEIKGVCLRVDGWKLIDKKGNRT